VDVGDTTVAVLGPGAVGGVFAVPLALAGFRVICVARAETAEAIRHDGLTLVRRGEELRSRPEAVEELDEPVDVLLVTVKAPALEDALERVRADSATVVPLLNGLEHVHRIRALFAGDVVAASVGRLEAYREGPTTVAQTTGAPVVTLAPDGQVGEVFEQAGAQVRTGASERAVLWEKVARLAPLAAATALTQRSVGELRVDPDWRARLEAAVAEACAVAAADGISLDAAAEWAIIDAMPPDLTTSTARDVAAGRPSELDAITGAVVRAGRRLGVGAPTLEGLLVEAEERCRTPSL
jgi:2-dehydropantoate 2-reductase